MMDSSATHPSEELLTSYLLGKLSDEEIRSLEDHLDACTECAQLAADQSPVDPLTSLLAQSATPPGGVKFLETMLHAQVPQNPFDRSEASSNNGYRHQVVIPVPPQALVEHPRYRIIRLLGRGGMGSVWLAEHIVMRREVALKVIRPELISMPGVIARFQREVEITAKLQHPNIAAAYDAEQIGEVFFLVMEYIPGSPLTQILKDRSFSIRETCRIVRDAASGLAYAHSKGLVHRDIKPGNILMTADGDVKVVDFGLVLPVGSESSITMDNLVMGTPDYISPEQAVNPRTADARSDIYSLGCTLFHLLAGIAPFPETSVVQKIDAHRYRKPVPPKSLPGGIAKLLDRMLAKDPRRRVQSAEEVAKVLDSYCQPGASFEQLDRMLTNRTSRRWIMTIVCCLIVLGSVWVYESQRTPQKQTAIIPPTQTKEMPVDSPDDEQSAVFDLIGQFDEPIDVGGVRPRISFGRNAQTVILSSDWEPRHVSVWNIKSGKVEQSLRTTSLDGAFATTTNRTRLAYQNKQGIVIAETSDLQHEVTQIATSGRSINNMQFDSTGDLLAYTDVDGGLFICHANTGELIWQKQLSEHFSWLKFSPDGQKLFSLGNRLVAWDVQRGTERILVDSCKEVTCNLSSDGSLLLLSEEKEIRVLDRNGIELRRIFGQTARISSICLSPNGRHIAAGDTAGNVDWRDFETGELEQRFFAHHRGTMRLEIDPAGRRLLSSGGNGTIRVWRIPTQQGIQPHSTIEFDGCVTNADISPDLQTAVVVVYCYSKSPETGTLPVEVNYSVYRIDLATQKRDLVFDRGKIGIRDLCFLQDRRRLVTSDDRIRIWNTETWEQVHEFAQRNSDQQNEPVSMGFGLSIDEQFLITTEWGTGIRKWNLETYQQVDQFKTNLGGKGWSMGAASPDGQHFTIGGWDSLLTLDLANGNVIRTYDSLARHSRVAEIEYSQDGSRILIKSGFDGTPESLVVQLIDATTGKEIRSWPASCGIFADAIGGQIYLSNIHSHAIEHWDVSQSQRTTVLTGHHDRIERLRMSQDFNSMISAGADGRLCVWHLIDLADSSKGDTR